MSSQYSSEVLLLCYLIGYFTIKACYLINMFQLLPTQQILQLQIGEGDVIGQNKITQVSDWSNFIDTGEHENEMKEIKNEIYLNKNKQAKKLCMKVPTKE